MENVQKLTGIDKKIIKSRLDGVAFGELSDTDLRLATDQLMFKGAAIYGCPLPTTEGFAEIISSELSYFLNEFGYGGLTLSEIFLALHLNATCTLRYPSGDYVTPILFTGHTFNVFFVAQILEVYKTLRNNLDRKLQNFIDGHP